MLKICHLIVVTAICIIGSCSSDSNRTSNGPGADAGNDLAVQMQNAIADFDKNKILSLLNQGASVDTIEPKRSRTALMSAMLRNEYDLVDTLINKQANFNIKDSDQDCPINALVTNINDLKWPISLLDKAISNGADVNLTCGSMGEAALHRAVEICNVEIVNLLLNNGADPEMASLETNQKPLHVASYRCPQATQILIKRGVKLSDADNRGNTPLQIAKKRKNKLSIKYLNQAGAK